MKSLLPLLVVAISFMAACKSVPEPGSPELTTPKDSDLKPATHETIHDHEMREYNLTNEEHDKVATILHEFAAKQDGQEKDYSSKLETMIKTHVQNGDFIKASDHLLFSLESESKINSYPFGSKHAVVKINEHTELKDLRNAGKEDDFYKMARDIAKKKFDSGECFEDSIPIQKLQDGSLVLLTNDESTELRNIRARIGDLEKEKRQKINEDLGRSK